MFRRFFNWVRSLFVGANNSELPPVVIDPVDSLPNMKKHPVIHTGIIKNATAKEEIMIYDAIVLLQDILADPLFYDEVMAQKFTETNGLSNQEIYDLLCKNVLVANVSMFTGNWKQNFLWHTVGLDIGDGFVYANRYFVQDTKTLASLIMHEMLHGLGFSHHGVKYTSVPYTFNRIIEKFL